jgi:hypothetical protein
VLNRALTSYILFLLLSDTFRSKQIASFTQYIRDLKGATPADDTQVAGAPLRRWLGH